MNSAIHLRFQTVPYGSSEYRETVALRSAILRRPLGLVFSPEQLAAERNDRHLACYLGERLAGCLILRGLDRERVQMRQVAVQEDLQGRGIGRVLVQEAETVAQSLGFSTMVLHARKSAVAFYEKLGYSRVGERFFEVTLPHWEMVKTLSRLDV